MDLSEGIDLSLFLFGNFQSYVVQNKYFSLEKDAIVFDVGANVGSMSLRFAQGASEGHVYAFEPTDYAFKKLQRNLSLNPKLAERISAVQQFLADEKSSSAARRHNQARRIGFRHNPGSFLYAKSGTTN